MIDPAKSYRTRDGREVRIYAVDGGLTQNDVHGAIRSGAGFYPAVWRSDGVSVDSDLTSVHPNDLIEVKPRIKREVWVNVYHGCTHVHERREDADMGCNPTRLACVKVTIDCEEGDGL